MKTKLILVLIIILGAFLRFYQLGALPNSFTPDEVAQGYSAYSILTTGQDEWGSTNIFNLRSFGDFKPPLQTLLMMPSIKLFGLTPFAIRFPNALISTLAILTTFLFATALTSSAAIGLISALFIAISPWHLPMSRLALEANLTVFFVSLASWLVLISSKRPWLQLLAAVLFSLNLISYHSAKYFTPLYAILLLCFYSKLDLKNLKLYKFFISASLILFAVVFLLAGSGSRVSDIAIFNPTDHWQSVSFTQYTAAASGLHPILIRIFNNKLTYIIVQYTRNFLSVFSPQFLYTQGAGETTYGMIPGFGVLGLSGFIGILFALYCVIKLPKVRPLFIFSFLVVVFGAIPASAAKSNYSANRLSTLMPFIQILAAMGIFYLFKALSTVKYLRLILIALFIIDSLYFLQTYYFQGNTILADGMLYGHQQANNFIATHPHSQVIYSRKTSEPQAYVMFFQQIDPVTAQTATPDWLRYTQEGKSFVDQMGNYDLGDYHFRELNFVSDSQLPDTILVGRPEEIPFALADRVIYAPDPNQTKPLFVLYDTSLHLK